MKNLRVALFSDSAPQLLARALETQAQTFGLSLQLQTYAFTSPLAVQTELHTFAPNAVILWHCSEAMTEVEPEPLEPLLALPYTFLVYNKVTLDDGAFGSCALTWEGSLRHRILRYNENLTRLTAQFKNLCVIDLDALQSRMGRQVTFDPRLWEMASVALTPNATQALATKTLSLLAALNGRLQKVLVTDLDNTFWGGIIGESGSDRVDSDAPGFRAYRAWLRKLSSRGILLAIASHNDRNAVEAQFKTEDLGFTLDDFQACEINWDPKPLMLQRIADTLHVNLDTLVFLDDRPEQRAVVREALPQVTVPELPDDPACRLDFLAQANLFETPRITADDQHRADTFRASKAREEAAQTLTREAYLETLQQELIAEPLSAANCERAAQLTQRCNRFNMRGTRHTAAELEKRPGWVYRLKDRFGDMGVISVVVLDGNIIETWVMSCRVFNRDVETLILEHLKQHAPIRGEYRATERNQCCQTIYADHGVPLP